MFEKRFFVPGLAHASYLFGAGGEAAVVDPKRDVDDYIETANQHGLKIVAVLNTHPHADFASGFRELAERTGAKIYTSHLAPVTYEHVPAHQDDRLRVGSLEVEILETPGHSPDSLSFLVKENGQPYCIYTGDLLFVGDVGRPDLRDATEDPAALAEKLYDSLFNRVFTLPDNVKVYPAHGAGSLCGRAISSQPFSLVGQERLYNWAAQLKDRREFVKQMTSNLPDRPAYFSYDVELNLRGTSPLNELRPLRALSEQELKEASAAGVTVIDTRPAPFFGAGHFPGSLNVGLNSAMFSTWIGFLVPGGKPIALVVGSADAVPKARLELARIGFDHVIGYIEADQLSETSQMSQISVCDLKASLGSGSTPVVLDVRTPGEWNSNHIDGALHIPLPKLPAKITALPKDQRMAVICGSGYRSSIAASLLEREGFNHLQNVMGGMTAYSEVKCAEMEPAGLVFLMEGI
ncbi:rhodanese-like domain-containing protein [Pedosphaera parvula]|uniref:Beta-lactamase domain protein n=1 Tax=Pedosphaera parvula (strain Ellin514) TaxID=320771 RepID=B9XAB6_PEDPL|nr:rhodanese-like domain-containing protein [Pedosphaera parvula]EEF63457.1 beta-lactamase domain protein [Pedosphaera parvula Ellin514]